MKKKLNQSSDLTTNYQATDEAFDILGFSQEEKDGLYKGTISIVYLGNSKWKQKGTRAAGKMKVSKEVRRSEGEDV